VKLRLEVDNPTFILRPDMLVDVEFACPPAAGGHGTRWTHWSIRERTRVSMSSAAKAVFEPRESRNRMASGERVEIRRGVKPG